ncbi:MAG: dienelactone hydrolase family protein, partial [Acidimicrobiia bacterium]
SSRLSPRNNAVAAELRGAGLATLLFDLLTEAEGRDRANVFDIGLLAGRLTDAIAWLDRQPGVGGPPLGCFGASTGAAAALRAAAQLPERVAAVVSRGGRPDLAEAHLPEVTAPTLLIVGELDQTVVEMNQRALQLLGGEKALEIVPGATHLFEEPGAMEEVTRLAREWFVRFLAQGAG